MERMRQLADIMVVGAIGEGAGVRLNYDLPSLLWLDDYIERTRLLSAPETYEYEVGYLGAFLGECLRQTVGGEWEPVEQDFAVRLPTSSGGSFLVFPRVVVRSQFRQGRRNGHSIAGEYQSAVNRAEGVGG